HRVTIVGVRPVNREGTVDLLPFSPAGSDPSSFCRLGQNVTKLSVSVSNQGAVAAPAAKATVLFNALAVTVDVPALPAGGMGDDLFDVLACFFSPDWSFTIKVDSGNQVAESNEADNIVNGGCVG